MKKGIEQPAAENPEELLDLKLSSPKKWAAGIPAVLEAGKDVFKEAGLVRGMEGLFHMNKKGGF
jgi:malonyl CoA-acyl carrier protein transacylase